MARCWSCGAEIPGGFHPRYWFTCPNCAQVEEIESLRRQASDDLSQLARIQEHGFQTLSDRLSEVATVIEWGFEDVTWELQQQTDILRSIDHTLKTPSETQANEWRRMAEEMRMRGVLDKSEELFLKALDLNPLDYRIYLGLAQTCLRMNQFKRAKTYLEESIPHAPSVKKLDYRSYSYRLIGHIYVCEEDYVQAAAVLKKSIELSPEYADAHYDYAQYSALTRSRADCLDSLQKAISGNPLYFSLAQKERNFAPLRDEIDKWLRRHKAEILHEAQEEISLAELELSELTETIAMIEYTFLRSLGWSEQQIKCNKVSAGAKSRLDELETSKNYKEGQSQLQVAKRQISTEDYTQLLRAIDLALDSRALALKANEKACVEKEAVERARERRVEKEKKDKQSEAAVFLLIGGVAAFIATAITENLTFALIGGIMVGLALVFYCLGYREF